MIQPLLDFALRQRLVVLAATLALIVVGINSYLSVPIQAYPDVGDTQVQVITQWQGHAAEEVERQITLPIERAMNTAPHQTSVRSVSIAGLSVVTVTFADGTDDYFARQQALERIAAVDLPDGVQAGLGPLASPIAEIMRYQLINCREQSGECSEEDAQVEPRSLSELKDLEEWVVERELLRVDGVADVASFGGTVKQYQVLLSPTLLSERGLALDDVEQEFDGDRERLEDAMSKALFVIPGVSFGFSQPISDNVEEALTGVKGQLAVKVIGDDLNALDDLGSRIAQEIAGVRGVRDLGIFREVGQSNMHLEIDRKRCERLGLSVQDVEPPHPELDAPDPSALREGTSW